MKLGFSTMVLLAVLVVTPFGVSAFVDPGRDADDAYRPAYSNCMSTLGETAYVARQRCASREFGYQDKRLNAAYRKALASAPIRSEGSAAELRTKQREWLKITTQECKVRSEGDKARNASESWTCRLQRTARRANALEGFAQTGIHNAPIEGEYRVPGECFTREGDEYIDCDAWNSLGLRRLSGDAYHFDLLTWTFATTQGGCGMSGTLVAHREADGLHLEGVPDEAKACKIAFVAGEQGLRLVEPAPNANGCQEFCGMNSSLYTDDFPRASRQFPADTDDD